VKKKTTFGVMQQHFHFIEDMGADLGEKPWWGGYFKNYRL